MDRVFGWFFRSFNRAFGAASNGYSRGVGGSCRASRWSWSSISR
jgi:hypothetical protein